MDIKIAEEPGWFGGFTRHEAKGAIPNGTTIQKINSEHGDTNPNGSLGVVLGSVDVGKVEPALAKRYNSPFAYFVEWHAAPRCAAFVAGFKIARPA